MSGILDTLERAITTWLFGDQDTEPQDTEPKPETPTEKKWKQMMSQIDEIIAFHYPGGRWSFVCADQATMLSDKPVAKEITVQTAMGGVEKRILIFETQKTVFEGGEKKERTVTLKPVQTTMEKEAMEEFNAPLTAEPEDETHEKKEPPEPKAEKFDCGTWVQRNERMLKLLSSHSNSGIFYIPRGYLPKREEDITKLANALKEDSRFEDVKIKPNGLEITLKAA